MADQHGYIKMVTVGVNSTNQDVAYNVLMRHDESTYSFFRDPKKSGSPIEIRKDGRALGGQPAASAAASAAKLLIHGRLVVGVLHNDHADAQRLNGSILNYGEDPRVYADFAHDLRRQFSSHPAARHQPKN
jgi:hypothetical protein